MLSSSPLLKSHTIHPTPEWCTLLCGVRLQLVEGDGPMIAFPLASWLIRVAGGLIMPRTVMIILAHFFRDWFRTPLGVRTSIKVIWTRQYNWPHKIDLKEEFRFLHKLGLTVAVFGKHLKKSYRRSRELILFIIITWLAGNELCYQDTLLEGKLNRLRNWICYGDLTGLVAKWRELDIISYKLKTYLARENPGVDYSAIIDKMFLNKDGKNYIYTLSKETQHIVRILHL
jgi:hypothetical protein